MVSTEEKESITMRKYVYATAIMKADNGKLFAEALRIPTNMNLASAIRRLHPIVTLNIMSSKSEAVETARTWEDTFIENGTAYFDRNYVTKCYDI